VLVSTEHFVSIATSSFPIFDPPLPVPAESLKRFTVDEYHAMIRTGVFAEDENFELLEGLLVRKMPKNPPHWIAVELLRAALNALNIPGYFVHTQNPVTTSDSEPEPDVALVRGQPRDYLGGNPVPLQAPLIVEVADSTLAQDRNWKKRIYAQAGVTQYWILNLVDRQMEIHTLPGGSQGAADYQDRRVVAAEGDVPVVIDGREFGWLKMKDLLP
jgi:Uma2 family endonuclease